MSQPGYGGRNYLGATLLLIDPNDGYAWRSDVTLFSQVSYTSSVTSVAAITAGATITPATGGTTQVTAIWDMSSCGINGSTTASTPAVAVVTLPAASGTYITNAAGSTITSVLIANVNDPAYSSQSAVAEHQIRVKIVYGNSYTRDLTTDSRATFGFADEASEALFGIEVCAGSSGNMCLTANAGVQGMARLLVSFAHETVTATLTVNVVRAIGLSVAPHPFPAWPQSGTVVVSTLRLIDVTQTYQQSQLLPSMLRSDGQSFHVTASTGLACTFVTANAAVIVSGRHATDFVVQPTRAGQFTFRCQMGLLLGDVISIAGDNTPGNITSFIDVSVHGAIGNTVHGIQGSRGRHQVRFGARFDDGWEITKTNMFSPLFPSTFRPRLASFSSGNEGTLSCDNITGSLVPMANFPETVGLSVSSLNGNLDPAVTGSTATYVNLQAGQLDVDFASNQARISQGNPLAAVESGESVLKVYVTTGSVRIGALTLGIRFDTNFLSFVSVAAGADDNVWQDSVLGEVSSVDSGLLRIGGVTTTYAQGTNWHFATVTFRPADNVVPGEAIFSGTIIEMADADAQVVVASGTSIIAGNQTTIVISHAERRDRRQGDNDTTTLAATTTAGEDANRAVSTTSGSMPPTSSPTKSPSMSSSMSPSMSPSSSPSIPPSPSISPSISPSTAPSLSPSTSPSTSPTWGACQIGRGPYPLGDVNQDCQFTGLDALLTAQYTLISHSGPAVATFLDRGNDVISVAAMDADVNGRVDTVDTSVLLYVLFGAARFVQRPALEMGMPETDGAQCQFSVTIEVEQSSADDLFTSNPSRSSDTAVLAIFTGGASDLSALQNVSWAGNNASGLTGLDDYATDGRFLAYRQTAHAQGTNRYTVSASILLGSADAIGITFGISVIQVINSDHLGWRVPFAGQYMGVGNRYPSGNQTENRQGDMVGVEFNIGESVAPVPFTYSSAFAPMAIVTIAQSETTCIVSTTTTTTTSSTSSTTSSTSSSSTTTSASSTTTSITTSSTSSTTLSSTTTSTVTTSTTATGTSSTVTTATTSTTTAATAATTTSTALLILQQVAVQAEEPDWWKDWWWIWLIVAISVCGLGFVVTKRRRRDDNKHVKQTAPVAIVSEDVLESMMIADHGADLGGWQQSENAQLWGQDGASPIGFVEGAGPRIDSPDGYLEVDDRRLSETPGGLGAAPVSGVKQILEQINQAKADELASTPMSVTNARPKRRLFDMDSPGGGPQEGPWEDIYPTQNYAAADEPIYSTGSTGLPADAAEFNRMEAKKAKDHKRTMRRRMSFFGKGGKSRGKLTREQLKWAEAQRQSEQAAMRPDGSMPRSMARPAVFDEDAGWKMAKAASKPSNFSPGGLGQNSLRKTGLSLEDARLEDAERKQQWLESFNNNTVWDANEEKWIYQKTDPWMSWGLAPREFEEPIYQPLGSVLGSESGAAPSSVPISEFDVAAEELAKLGGHRKRHPPRPPVAPPPVPSTLNRAALNTLNRGPIKPPTMTVVNAGGGGLASERILEDRPLGVIGTGITSISGHFDPTGHSGYLSMRPDFPDEQGRPQGSRLPEFQRPNQNNGDTVLDAGEVGPAAMRQMDHNGDGQVSVVRYTRDAPPTQRPIPEFGQGVAHFHPPSF